MSNQNLTQIRQARNGHTPAEAFEQAFFPSAEDKSIGNDLLSRWSLSASEAIRALIDFRSALHRWQATGNSLSGSRQAITEAEFMAEVQKMAEAGLLEWLDGNPNGLDLLRQVVTGGEL